MISSANEVRIALPALALRDKLLTSQSVPSRGTAIQRASTVDATPTPIAGVRFAEGEMRTFEIVGVARQPGDPEASAEAAQYRCTVAARRPLRGDVELLGTPTVTVDAESTGSMDLTVSANTGDDLIELVATGVAGTDLTWTTELRAVGSPHEGM